MESEVPPTLPTSGQILGVLVKAMGLRDHRLRSKTAMRYFSGSQESLVKESSRSEVIEAISDALSELGFESTPRTGEGHPCLCTGSLTRRAGRQMGQDEELYSTQNVEGVPGPPCRRLDGVPQARHHRSGPESCSSAARPRRLLRLPWISSLDRRRPPGSLSEREDARVQVSP